MTQKRVRIKMCGMMREQDIAHAVALGVDAIGLIFYPKSPRCVSVEDAKILVQNAPVFLDIVAVLVNPLPSLVEQITHELPIQYLQFHGDEAPEFCTQFNKPFIKAIRANSRDFIDEQCAKHRHASAILLDTPSPVHGGTGQVFDWTVIPENIKKPLILAGGLSASNIRKAVTGRSVYAVDVCSGVEASPGIKDHNKMSQFVNALWGEV
ncbi:phosphoribosylanthranilate isomerase [Legionella cardiaca]|uniref:N-(5'-phosphoribosyl)anthranilate isomerase n=1 Tax=Legionella cardiaca TaxID=1071983 RepID=A0ABY8AU28_9GAMM|nr:phosphoribosylanthranilate isomerase [Legionella cardiaca]WED44078.1 phosphoribosylanthranilate isomerase [Legionella cardiaca]